MEPNYWILSTFFFAFISFVLAVLLLPKDRGSANRIPPPTVRPNPFPNQRKRQGGTGPKAKGRSATPKNVMSKEEIVLELAKLVENQEAEAGYEAAVSLKAELLKKLNKKKIDEAFRGQWNFTRGSAVLYSENEGSVSVAVQLNHLGSEYFTLSLAQHLKKALDQYKP